MKERPTPETDAHTFYADDVYCGGSCDAVRSDICQRIERQRDEARELARKFGSRLHAFCLEYELEGTLKWCEETINENQDIFKQTKP